MIFHLHSNGVDEFLPLIYLWEIYGGSGELVGRYVGKASGGASRPRKHYSRNVKNLLAGKPYRRGAPDGFRRIHRALAKAQTEGFTIALHLICNVRAGEDINAVERYWIAAKNTIGNEPWQLND